MQVVHPAETSGLFHHICPLDALWLDYAALIDPFDALFVQLA